MIVNNPKDMEAIQLACDLAAVYHKKQARIFSKAQKVQPNDLTKKEINFHTDRAARCIKLSNAAYIKLEQEKIHEKAAS